MDTYEMIAEDMGSGFSETILLNALFHKNTLYKNIEAQVV